MCFETLIIPLCPTCLEQDGEPGWEGIKCAEAKKKWLGHGKCSQVPPVKQNPAEQYLNEHECFPCGWETEKKKKKEAEEKEAKMKEAMEKATKEMEE